MAFDPFSLIGSIGGGLLGFMGAQEQADAVREANAASGPTPWGPAVPYMEDYMRATSDLYGRQGFAPTTNELQLLGRANQLGYAENMLPGLIGATQQSWLTGLDPSLNPYVGAMIEAAQQDLVQDFQRNVIPSIADASQRVGGYGGSRQGVAQGIASEGLLESLADVETRLLSNAYGQALNQQQAAWNAAPTMLNMGFMPSQTQQQVGGSYRGDMLQPAENLTAYGSAMSPFFTMMNVAAQPVPSPYQGALTGAGMGAYAGGLFSPSQTPTPQTVQVAPSTLNQPLGQSQFGGFAPLYS